MRRIGLIAALVMASTAAADVWSPLDFFVSENNPAQDAKQPDGAAWTFRRGSYDGILMTGIRGALTCEPGIGLWGRAGGAYGFLPCVGPRVSPNEVRDDGTEQSTPEFEGLMVIPTDPEDAVLVFTATGPVTVPTLTLRGEMLYAGQGNGVLLTVSTRINGKNSTWLDAALVPPTDKGFQEWTLFQNDHPQLKKGDVLWIDVDPNGTYQADWANVSLTSAGCYADCTGEGTLDLFDFLCFVNGFNAGDANANCDGNEGLDLFDFLCFVNAFNAGC